jgi:hypothetical protein
LNTDTLAETASQSAEPNQVDFSAAPIPSASSVSSVAILGTGGSVSELVGKNIPEDQRASDSQISASVNAMPDRISKSDWLMIGLTSAIALSGFLGTWVFYCQLNEMRSGSKDTHDLAVQAKASAEAARIMADKAVIQAQATNDLVDVTKRQAASTRDIADRAIAQAAATNKLAKSAARQSEIAERSLALSANADRPWVWMVTPSIATLEADKPIVIPIALANAGRSPARVVEYIVVSGANSTIPRDLDKESFAPVKNSQLVVVPGSQSTHSFTLPALNQEVIDAIRAKTVMFFVYCRVTYEDISTHQRHRTTGCFVWDTETSKLVLGPHNNDAD